MAESTAIEWADATWSPWEGCTKVSPGCDHCYADAMNRWLRNGANWGPGAQRREYGDEHWEKPGRWNAKAQVAGRRLRVFPSVCDPFDNEVSNTRRSRFIGLMYDTPWIDWLLLTKRIGNVARLMEECTEPGKRWELPPNAWIGATVVNQEEADRDIPKLLAVPARRFLSIEPMLGPVDLQRWLWVCCGNLQPGNDHGLYGVEPDRCCGRPEPRDTIDWVIAGGESGRHARPMNPGWVRGLRDQCAAAGVPFLFKQWGEWLPGSQARDVGKQIAEVVGCDRGWRWDDGTHSWRVGKKAAGRLLDGRTHDDFPAAAIAAQTATQPAR